MDLRPDWDDYFLRVVDVVAQRSSCIRRRVGALLEREKRILSTGYNGAPIGLPHCTQVGCLRESMGIPSGERHELCRGLHAEQNAIIQAALHGVSTEGATLYVSCHPCSVCAKMLVNAGITRVVMAEGYPDGLAGEILAAAGVKLETFVPKP